MAEKKEKEKKDLKKKGRAKPEKISLSKKEYLLLKEKADGLVKCTDSLLRLRAEFENNRKRLQKEKKDFAEYANYELIKQLLPILDNFGHALQNLNKHNEKEIKGIEIIYNQFRNILGKEGLERIKTKGEKFDPRIHHAVMQEESNEHPENTIIEEMQAGYTFKGRLIRAAMVKVSKIC